MSSGRGRKRYLCLHCNVEMLETSKGRHMNAIHPELTPNWQLVQVEQSECNLEMALANVLLPPGNMPSNNSNHINILQDLDTKQNIVVAANNGFQNDNKENSVIQLKLKAARTLNDVFRVLGDDFQLSNGTLICTVCAKTFKLPDRDIDETSGNLTTKFSTFKSTLKEHLKTKTHNGMGDDTSYLGMQKKESKKDVIARNYQAAMNTGYIVYNNLLNNQSYASFESQIYLADKMGGHVGSLNHNRSFPPQFVNSLYLMLKQSLMLYIEEAGQYLGFPIPFSLTADKVYYHDGKSSQVVTIRIPFLFSHKKNKHNDSSVFIDTLYLGHIDSDVFCGDALADDIISLLQTYDITRNDIRNGMVGGNFDGQYSNLNVLEPLITKCDATEKHIMNVFEGSYLVELAILDVLSYTYNTSVYLCSQTICSVLEFMGYGKKCEVLKQLKSHDSNFQLDSVIEIKFLQSAHELLLFFENQYSEILTSLERMRDGGGDVEADYHLTLITDQEFLLLFYFMKDLIGCLTRYSHLFMNSDLLVSDYLNTVLMLHYLLKKLQFVNPDERTMCLFPGYFRLLQNHNSPQISRIRNSVKEMVSVDNVKRDLEQFCEFLGDRLHDRMLSFRSMEYICAGTKVLNKLASELGSLYERSEIVMCVYCESFFRREQVGDHYETVHKDQEVKLVAILEDYNLDTDVKFEFQVLNGLLDKHRMVSPDILQAEFDQMIYVLKQVACTLKTTSPLRCLKTFFSKSEYYHQVPADMKHILLKLLILSVSGEKCKKFRLQIAEYDKRVKDKDLEYSSIQKEIFIRNLGPPIADCDDFISRALMHLNMNFVPENKNYRERSTVLRRYDNERHRYPFKFKY